MEPIVIEALILESNSGTAKKTGNPYTIVMLKPKGGRVMKAFSKIDLKESEGLSVFLNVELQPQGDKQFASVSILSRAVKPK
jgi:hypothetical protein